MNDEATQRIWIEDDRIIYQTEHGHTWTFSIPELELVGEYTDSNGPYIDDYFFIFVTHGVYYEASFYAKGRDEFLVELGKALGVKQICSLTNSTDYNSRVMWPPELEDKQLFNFVPVKSNGIWQKLRHKIIPETYFIFTKAVTDYLNVPEGTGL